MSSPPLLAHALTSVSLLVLNQWRHCKIRRACEQSGKWRSPKNCFEGNVWRECLVQRKGHRNNLQISWSFCLLQNGASNSRSKKTHGASLGTYDFLHYTYWWWNFILQTNLQLDESTNDFFGSLGSTAKKWPFQGPALCGRPQGAFWVVISGDVMVKDETKESQTNGSKVTPLHVIAFYCLNWFNPAW